ncbi:hypothetical protein [Paenibacillus cymbidii]|uniref:hypothetical protein n=1 Tax=Paenibacillus cymbidii TaxID=1639034 RepID=UPI001081473A|nr:hypothetical protein [Paenibacillus cymbidii]
MHRPTSKQTKLQLEREAVRLFVSIHNRTSGNPLRLLYQQDKPDAVLMDSRGCKLGLEITHLFYDQEEARQQFLHQHRSFVCIESFAHLVEELNQLLARKEAKSRGYNHEYPLALLIRNLSLNFGWNDFDSAWDAIKAPSEAFTDIWFLARDSPGSPEWYLKSLKSS